MLRFILFYMIVFMFPFVSFAQRAYKKQGDIYFDAGKYSDALDAYSKHKKIDKEAETLIKRGIANYYTGFPDACISDMAGANILKSKDPRQYQYTGMAYMAKQDYVQAARFFKTHLNVVKPNSQEWFESINQIKRCGYAQNQKYGAQLAFVENLGPNVNSIYEDFAPVQSPTKQGRYYFSSAREDATGGMRDPKGLVDEVRGKYSSDMYLVDLKDGNWSSVLPFEQLLNSPKHDILQDFSPDGSIIYYIKSSDLVHGTLYSDTFSIDRDPTKLTLEAQLPMDASNGDKDLFIFNDSLILFSSNRSGGYGGYDIYYSIRQNNAWELPVNLGPSINSGSNEDHPFLTKSGTKLYFSSDRLTSLGGYDIFAASHNTKSEWSDVKNLGLPINSSGDDLGFELSADGSNALFSSNRIESIGGHDLYMAYFKEQELEQLAFVEIPPFIPSLLNDSLASEPIVIETPKAEVLPVRDFVSRSLYFKDNDDVLNPINLNLIKKVSDLMIIYPEISITLTSHYIYESKNETDLYFSIKRAEKVAEKLILSGISPHRITLFGCGANFPVATPVINGIASSLANKVNKRIDINVVSDPSLNLRVLNDNPSVAEQYRDTLWDTFIENNNGITFRVKFSKVSQMLKSDILNLRNDVIIEKRANDGLYTYTAGNFSSYNDARLLKNEMIRKNMTEATVVPYLKGVSIDKAKANNLATDYPELSTYLKFE
ncbi:MAG TPA: OmpA family protein [Saprospiraceae bacterium]|nr:OmpA family protein [Saprospiraceae bacterium]